MSVRDCSCQGGTVIESITFLMSADSELHFRIMFISIFIHHQGENQKYCPEVVIKGTQRVIPWYDNDSSYNQM